MNIPKLPELPDACVVYEPAFAYIEIYAVKKHALDEWYKKLKAWHSAIFENALEVSLAQNRPDCLPKWITCNSYYTGVTHKALLINIQPIREESAEDILRELTEYWFKTSTLYDSSTPIHEIASKAKAFLAKQGKK